MKLCGPRLLLYRAKKAEPGLPALLSIGHKQIYLVLLLSLDSQLVILPPKRSKLSSNSLMVMSPTS